MFVFEVTYFCVTAKPQIVFMYVDMTLWRVSSPKY